MGLLGAVESRLVVEVCRLGGPEDDPVEVVDARDMRLLAAAPAVVRVVEAGRDGGPMILEGRGLAVFGAVADPLVLGVGLAAGFGCSSTFDMPVGWTNMPWPGSQSKYLSPWTEPSFLPSGPSNTTPTHVPALKLVSPTKRMTPLRPSFSRMVWPTL